MLILLILLVLCRKSIEDPSNWVSTEYYLDNGRSIPRIGLGTAGLGTRGAQIVEEALRLGYAMIDTAQAPEWYSERLVSEGLSAYRSSDAGRTNDNATYPFTITKVHPRSFARERLEMDLNNSRKMLCDTIENGVEMIDMVLIHSPICWPNHCSELEIKHTWEDCWRGLEELKSQGKLFRYIGVSNFNILILRQLIASSNTPVSLIQNWCDPFHQDKEVRTLAKNHNIAYMAYSSFGTQWTSLYEQNPVMSSPDLLDIAKKHNCSVHEVVLSWLLQDGIIVVPRSKSLKHLEKNLFLHRKIKYGPFCWYDCFLDDNDMRRIASLDNTLGDP